MPVNHINADLKNNFFFARLICVFYAGKPTLFKFYYKYVHFSDTSVYYYVFTKSTKSRSIGSTSQGGISK